MNWIKIKEKCPKAFDILNIWICKEFGCDKIIATPQNYLLKIYPKNEIHYFFERRLFDFFDEQEIYIALDIYWSDHKLRFLAYNFQVKETDKDFEINELTRIEAEEKAFTEAFKILEKN